MSHHSIRSIPSKFSFRSPESIMRSSTLGALSLASLLALLGSPARAQQVRESDQAAARFGWSVATAGDVNGDGYADVIAGAPGWSNGQSCEGKAFVYLGSATGIGTNPAWSYESNQAGSALGASVSSAGDTNNDGYDDIIVGAPAYDNGQVDEGRAFVFLGGANGPATSASWTAESNQANARFGSSVGWADKVNSSNYSAVLVGAPEYDNGQTDEGRAFAYLGSSSGPQASAGWTTESNQAGAAHGGCVASAGDVNGDGYDDVMVGAMSWDTATLTNAGRATVYHSGASGISTTAAWTTTGATAQAFHGSSVATAGDVNRDGEFDVAVGAWSMVNGEIYEGRTYVYHGSNSGLSTTAARTYVGGQSEAGFGYSVATAGKFDSDNYWDLVVGEPLYDGAQADAGQMSVYYGAHGGLGASSAWKVVGTQLDGQLGMQVATAGDVNADGRWDIVVGVPWHGNGQAHEGAIRVYLTTP